MIFKILTLLWLKKNAKSLCRKIEADFPNLKQKEYNKKTQEIILNKIFNKEKLNSLKTKKRIETCCKTINGFCYMMGLDMYPLNHLPNYRCINFIDYMDRELELAGFPKQTINQKREILEAMELGEVFERKLELNKLK